MPEAVGMARKASGALQKPADTPKDSRKLALARAETVTVPWGAAHMPGLAKGLEERGFRLVQQQEFEVVRFKTIFHVQAPRTRVPSPP